MKPFVIFGKDFEEEALEQFFDAMAQDFVVKGALMPDAHLGYSLPIGAVVATYGVVVPAWVGFDIGCGMCAVPTTFTAGDVCRHAKDIFNQIYREVPVGFSHNSRPALTGWDWEGVDHTFFMHEEYKEQSMRQLGTLGGGNHFIEIGEDESEVIWIIVHSGSRGLGHKTATHWMRQASKLHTGIEKAKEGHYGFEDDTISGMDYLADLNYCLEFALANRRKIIARVELAMQNYIWGNYHADKMINRNHNHVEEKDGLWVHRKGATHAEKDMMGVIPGNMRDGSFIVRGKGNPGALWSSSHGAGRAMGRKVAKQTLDFDKFQTSMKGVQAKVEPDTLDEAPGAYKNIFKVMDMQTELVDITHHICPIINIKA